MRIQDLTAYTIGEMQAAQDLLRKILKLSAGYEEKSGGEGLQQQG